MDFRQWVADRHSNPRVLEAATRAVAAARTRGYCDFRASGVSLGLPGGEPANRSFSTLAGPGRIADGHPATDYTDLTQAEGDIVVIKKRSAFSGSEPELLLRSRASPAWLWRHCHRRRRALHGEEAAARDYRLTVLGDACTEGDDEVHQVLLNKVFPRQANVLAVTDWTARLEFWERTATALWRRAPHG
jgi:hypothetical protein